MLDADEAAAFDEAMRHDPELRNAYQEMARLAAAVAVTAAVPIAPQAGQLERLHLRLGLHAAKRANWLGITGWAAAAALTMILVLDLTPQRRNRVAGQPALPPVTRQQPSVVTPPGRDIANEEESLPTSTAASGSDRGLAATRQDGNARVISKVETKRLIQEIEVLRGQLESVLERDRKRFESVPGIAWPIIVRMRPPENFAQTPGALAVKLDDPAITSMLGDALTAANLSTESEDPFAVRAVTPTVQETPLPSAIPIYDSARDSGTFVVSHLPAIAADETYNLWVTTKTGDKPVHVGRLPESNIRGGESFDFSLGSKATVPSGFILTKDRQGTPPLPSLGSTVLQGPR